MLCAALARACRHRIDPQSHHQPLLNLMDFPWVQCLVLLASNGVFCLGTWIIWPSRWNMIAAYQLGFFCVSTVIPLLMTEKLLPANSFTTPEILNLYAALMGAGAICYLLGLLFGARLPRFCLIRVFRLGCTPAAAAYVRHRTVSLVTLAVAGVYVSFAIMGYIPMFAAEPLQAKYFHDAYRPGYLRAIWLFLPSFCGFSAYVPLFMLIAWRSRRRFAYGLILLAGTAAVALTLHRGEFGGPLLLGIGLIVAGSRRRSALPLFLVSSIIFWCLGAAANFLTSVYLGLNTGSVPVANETVNIWDVIAGGAQDIPENGIFLEKFTTSLNPPYTFGRTWIGGLIPNQSKWNPMLWPLSIEREMTYDEVRNAVSGGLRIFLPITGYSAFDWPGALSFSLLVGVLTGYVVRFARDRISDRAPPEINALVALLTFQLSLNCGAPTWHSLLPLLAFLLLTRPFGFSLFQPSAMHNITLLAAPR